MVICRDLKDRGFLLRILAVHSGHHWHHPKKWYAGEPYQLLKKRAMKVARELIKQGRANRVVFVDDKHFKFPNHFHIQICMR